MSKPKSVYIVANYAMKPRDPRQTFKAGYIKDGDNMHWDERVDVTVGIKDRDLAMAQIILNISEQKVVKNSFMSDKSFMELFQHYYTSSPHEISQALKNCGITVSEQEKPKAEAETEHSTSQEIPPESIEKKPKKRTKKEKTITEPLGD